MSHSQLFLSLYLVTIFSLLVSFATPKPPNGFSLELIQRDSPQSPFYPGILTNTEQVNRLVEFSNIKANSYNSGIYPQDLRLKLFIDSSFHLVKIQIGTPGIPLYLLPDTGSSLVWIQCEPCTHRFHQIPPIYNSTASITFKKLPCEHPFCRNNNPFFKCQNGECVYRQQYLGGAITEGVAASEAFEPMRNTHTLLYFGCSRNNQNFSSFEHTGRSGGIMGLGLSPISLLQQLSNITHHRFSYCLVPIYLGTNTSSFLRFGNDISTRGRSFKSTPIVTPPNVSHYYVNLQDISIDKNRIGFSPDTFALKHDGSGGCLIDSGSPLTNIIQPAYQRLLTAFQNYFHQHGFEPVHLPQVRYDLCYKYSSTRAKRAAMTFHFRGADMEVKEDNVYVNLKDHGAFCLALKSSPYLTLVGAVQQANTRFIYDAAARQILFSPENCLKDK